MSIPWALLFAIPFLAPIDQSDTTGAILETSRVAKAFSEISGDIDHDSFESEDFFADETHAEDGFATLQSFAEQLVRSSYDLPPEYAAVLDRNFARLL